MLIELSEIECAAERIRPYLPTTPLIHSRYYSERTGADVYLKLETLQPTHSFKVRGAFNAILALPGVRRAKGVISASQGNHGLGVALAASTLGIRATIYLPSAAPANRVAALRALGAEVILSGASWDEANRLAQQVAETEGRAYIHPFNDRAVMAGQGTIVLELLQQQPTIDWLLASVGGGGLLSGLLAAVKGAGLQTRVAGVETAGADCMAQSLRAGSIVELPAITSIASSLGARRTELPQFEMISRHVSEFCVVSDEAALQAVRETLDHEKLLIEPAAGCVLAALTGGQIPLAPHDRVVVVVCGANTTVEEIASFSARAQHSH